MTNRERRALGNKGFHWTCSCRWCRAEDKVNKRMKRRLFRRRLRQLDRIS